METTCLLRFYCIADVVLQAFRFIPIPNACLWWQLNVPMHPKLSVGC